jgi:hypothetical protein
MTAEEARIDLNMNCLVNAEVCDHNSAALKNDTLPARRAAKEGVA